MPMTPYVQKKKTKNLKEQISLSTLDVGGSVGAGAQHAGEGRVGAQRALAVGLQAHRTCGRPGLCGRVRREGALRSRADRQA